MKKLNDSLKNKFYNVCEDIKNSRNFEALNFNVGVACGFASGLLLSRTIVFDCYTAMHDHISVVRESWHLTK